MTQMRGETAFYDVASVLVTGVADELVGSIGGAVQRQGVVPGEAVWDECDCGLLVATVTRFFLSDSFPQDAVSSGEVRIGPCELPWVVGEIHVQVARCAPVAEKDQLQPTVEALDRCARVLYADSCHLLERATSELCELKSAERIVDYVTGEGTVVGPLGDCVGVDLRILVALER